MSNINKEGVQEMTTFSYRWKIKRFFDDCHNIGDSYTSTVFSIHRHDKVTKWYLQVYPKGCRQEYKDYVGLYLFRQSQNVSDKVVVDYQLSILNKEKSIESSTRLARAFTAKDEARGFPDFVRQAFLEDVKNGALVNDTLTIKCDITFCDQAVRGKLADLYNHVLNNQENRLEDYESLLESNCFSDVTFNIQDNKIHLHKAILICRNAVFKAMFEHELKPQKRQKLMDVVEIKDVAYSVMKEVFRFIYSGKVENIDQMSKDLLIAADKYAVPELKALCEINIYNNLTVDNAIEYLKLTDVCDTIHLKTLVMEFIAAHCKEIVKKPGFTDLDKQVMHRIIKLITEKD